MGGYQSRDACEANGMANLEAADSFRDKRFMDLEEDANSQNAGD